jgi:uncharacterized protein (DUF362 family)
MATTLIQQTVYDRAVIKQHLATTFDEMGGLESLLGDKRRIVLKPNFVVPEVPEKAATTHPDVYMAVAEILQESGREVAIGESPGFGSAESAVRLHGVQQECADRGIRVLTFRRAKTTGGIADPSYRKLSIAAELDEFDALVNLPKLKVHQQFVFTAATKNLYGCVTGKRKFYRHNICANDPVRFARMIIKNAELVDPVLNIGDGITAMHVKGPRGGQPYPLGKLVVSDSFLEHDWLVCQLIGLAQLDTPLFQALPVEDHAALIAACEGLLPADFAVPADFRQSYRIHISFSPWHLLRSIWRTVKFQIQELAS